MPEISRCLLWVWLCLVEWISLQLLLFEGSCTAFPQNCIPACHCPMIALSFLWMSIIPLNILLSVSRQLDPGKVPSEVLCRRWCSRCRPLPGLPPKWSYQFPEVAIWGQKSLYWSPVRLQHHFHSLHSPQWLPCCCISLGSYVCMHMHTFENEV